MERKIGRASFRCLLSPDPLCGKSHIFSLAVRQEVMGNVYKCDKVENKPYFLVEFGRIRIHDIFYVVCAFLSPFLLRVSQAGH